MQNGPDFDKLIEPFVRVYQNIEHDLLIKIASHFKLYEDIGFKNSMEWYIKKLEELGGLNNEAVEIISKYSKIPKAKIIKMLKEAGLSTIELDDIEKLNKTRDYKIDVDKLINSETFNNIINNSYKELNKVFKLINTKAVEATKQSYMDVLNQAYTEVSSGANDYNTAISKAINKLVNQGITIVQYKQKDGSIRNYSIDSCVRRDVSTAVVQCTNRASDNFIKELNAEYVEVSQHVGARVTNTFDYKDHAWWQGGIYKIEGSTKEYPNFQETCNEGDVQGIGGANCRHIKWAFFPGISVPKAIHIDEEENRKVYEQYQTQRKYEKRIKIYKNKIDTFKKIEAYDKVEKYKTKLKNIHTEYDEYCDVNNLRRNYNRERNYIINKSSSESTLYKDVTKEWLKNATPNSHEIKDMKYWVIDDKRIKVDKKSVVLDYKPNGEEYKCAEWLKQTFGGEIFMCPRVLKPDGISTPDYLWKGAKWDLKALNGNGKRLIDSAIKKKKNQADNFILDMSNCKLSKKEILSQAEKVFNTKGREWVNVLIIKNNDKVEKIYIKK